MNWIDKKHPKFYESEAQSDHNKEIIYRVNRNMVDEDAYSLYIHDADDLILFAKRDDPYELKNIANHIDYTLAQEIK